MARMSACTAAAPGCFASQASIAASSAARTRTASLRRSPSSSPCARFSVFFCPATVEAYSTSLALSPAVAASIVLISPPTTSMRVGSSHSIWLANSEAVRWRKVTPG